MSPDEYKTPKKKKTPSKKASGSTPKSAGRKSVLTKAELVKTLKALTHAQVIDVVCKLAADHPEIKEDLKSLLPAADVDAYLKELMQARRRISRAFPRTRYGNGLDHYSFKRVRPTLTAFRSLLLKQAAVLGTSSMPAEFAKWAETAFRVIQSLPDWNNDSDNSSYPHLFERIAKLLQGMGKKAGGADAELLAKLEKKFSEGRVTGRWFDAQEKEPEGEGEAIKPEEIAAADAEKNDASQDKKDDVVDSGATAEASPVKLE